MTIPSSAFILIDIGIIVLYILAMAISYHNGFLYGLVELLYTLIIILVAWFLSPVFAKLMPLVSFEGTTMEIFHIEPLVNTITYFAIICLIICSLFPDLEIGYPWCVNIAFTAAACILVGVAVRDDIIRLTVAKGWVLITLLLGSISIYYVLLKHLGDRFVIMMMCKGSYGDPFYAIAFALLGSFAVGLLSMLLKRMADEWIPEMDLKPVTYIGQHTMGIFLLHKPILQSILIRSQ